MTACLQRDGDLRERLVAAVLLGEELGEHVAVAVGDDRGLVPALGRGGVGVGKRDATSIA